MKKTIKIPMPHKAEHYLDNSVWCTVCKKWFYPKVQREHLQKEANKYMLDTLFPQVKVAITEILLKVLQ